MGDSVFSIPSASDQVVRFFVARFLDSPLIADRLSEEILEAIGRDQLSPSGRHLRNLLFSIVRSHSILEQDPPVPFAEAISDLTVYRITPLALIDIAESLERLADASVVPELVGMEQAKIVERCLAKIGVPSPIPFSIPALSREWFERENKIKLVKARLIAERARGSRSSIIAEIASRYSTHVALSDRYAIWINSRTRSVYVGTFDMFLAVQDIIRVRARVYLSAALFYPNSKLVDRMKAQFVWQKRWIELFGNQGFSIAKQTESLNKAYLVYLSDKEFRVSGPYQKMWNKILDKAKKYASSDDNAVAIVDASRAHYERYVEGASIQEVVELFGVQKTIGHPFIYAGAGGKSAAKEALQEQYSRPQHIDELQACWRSMFTEGFIHKYKRWPKLYFSSNAKKTTLYQWYSAGYLNVSVDDFIWDDWIGVTFGKEFDLDTLENYLVIIDDKAISYNRDELDAYWDRNVASSTNRRLLLEISAERTFRIARLSIWSKKNEYLRSLRWSAFILKRRS
jgi:hypothetical protein